MFVLRAPAIVLFCLFGLSQSLTARAQEVRDASTLLPPTTSVYLEIQGTDALRNLELTKFVMSTPLYRELWSSPDVMKMRGGITLVELTIGERLPAILGRATARGIVVAIDNSTQGALLMLGTDSPAAATALRDKVFEAVQTDARSKGREERLKQSDYRGLPVYEYQGGIAAALGNWLIFGNKSELARQAADRYLDSSSDSLAKFDRFKQARQKKSTVAHRRRATPMQSDGLGYTSINCVPWHRAAALRNDSSNNAARTFWLSY